MAEHVTAPAGERRWPRWLPGAIVVLAVLLAPFVAQQPASAGPDDDLLRAGADVYNSVCSGCHQPGGAGLSGRFPPLADNPNLDDADYIADVIRNGREGPIEVNGETYDSVMPAQSTLSDDDVTAVIAYIQSGFAAPAGPVAEVASGPVAGTQLPALTNFTVLAAFAIVFGALALILGPRVVGSNDRRTITWADAWLKTAVIVVGLIVALVIVPDRVLGFDAVQELPRMGQDLIAVSIWGAAIGASLWALWYAHRERRV